MEVCCGVVFEFIEDYEGFGWVEMYMVVYGWDGFFCFGVVVGCIFKGERFFSCIVGNDEEGIVVFMNGDMEFVGCLGSVIK